MTLRIRHASQADAGACAAIYAPFVRDTAISFELEPPSTKEMARRIGEYGTSHGWLVAEVGGQVAGYAYGSPHAVRAAYARSCDVGLYIDPAFARRGLGRALYEQLLPALAARGYHVALARIALPHPASEGLHEAMGFTLAGVFREVGWKFDRWHDVGWWQRLL